MVHRTPASDARDKLFRSCERKQRSTDTTMTSIDISHDLREPIVVAKGHQ